MTSLDLVRVNRALARADLLYTAVGARLLAAGWESDIFRVTLESRGTEIPSAVALRRYVGGSPVRPDPQELEAITLSEVGARGYPVPKVFAVVRECAPGGRPFTLMELIRGSSLAASVELGERLGVLASLMVQLHSLDPASLARRLGIEATPRFEGHLDLLARISVDAGLDDMGSAFAWLRRRGEPVTCMPDAILHWDLHPGNVLMDGRGPVIIDWTASGVGDPRYDVAWTRMLLGDAGPAFAGAYRRAGGISLEDLDFFDATCYLRRIITLVACMRLGPNYMGFRPELADRVVDLVPSLRGAYEGWLAATGVELPGVAEFLDDSSRPME